MSVSNFDLESDSELLLKENILQNKINQLHFKNTISRIVISEAAYDGIWQSKVVLYIIFDTNSFQSKA